MRVDEIPVAKTPPGGYGEMMPPPILGECTEPLIAGAPDMRGTWKVESVEWKVGDPPDPNPIVTHVERIEQCADRVVVTASGVIHDMRADGTVEGGVNDVAAANGQPISVVCTFENGVHTLRPVGMPDVVVTRRLEDPDHMVWEYGPLFTARLERVAPA
jgi:hypothetical protein